jgi:hypothetical protein
MKKRKTVTDSKRLTWFLSRLVRVEIFVMESNGGDGIVGRFRMACITKRKDIDMFMACEANIRASRRRK